MSTGQTVVAPMGRNSWNWDKSLQDLETVPAKAFTFSTHEEAERARATSRSWWNYHFPMTRMVSNVEGNVLTVWVPLSTPRVERARKFTGIPTTPFYGSVTLENLEYHFKNHMSSDGAAGMGDIDIQVSSDGKIWLNMNGVSLLRFVPREKGVTTPV